MQNLRRSRSVIINNCYNDDADFRGRVVSITLPLSEIFVINFVEFSKKYYSWIYVSISIS